MIFYVYEHWRLDTDTCFYVGKGSGDRAYRKKNRNSHWRNIVAKLERTGSAYEVRIVASGLTEEDSFNLERERIAFWRDIVDLANITDGGTGVSGYVFTEADREKIRQNTPVKRGKDHPMFGRKRPDVVERNKAQKGLKNPNRARKGEDNPNFGKPRAEETKRKISLSNRGKVVSEETRAKQSASAKLRMSTSEGKANVSAAGKKGAASRWSKVTT